MAIMRNRKSATSAELKKFTLIRDIIIIFICVLGMGVSLWFFSRNILNSKEQPDEKPIGTVYWVNNNVKRLSAGRLQWEKLERNSQIFDRDMISSAAFSDAKISFVNGEILELSGNTSIGIKYLNQEIPSIDLMEGEIEIQSSQFNLAVIAAISETEGIYRTKVSVKKYTVNLDPRTGAGIKAFDDMIMKVYQGSGTLSSAGKFYNIAAGETLKADINGNISSNSQVVMFSPRNGTRIFHTSQIREAVKFEWRKTGDRSDSTVILEISETSNFSRLIGSWNWENADSAVIQLSPGTYYWKLFTRSSPENFDSGRLDIVQSNASRALYPANGSSISLQPGKREMHFSWIVPEEAEAVLLEAADNPEMTRPRLFQLIRRTKNGRGTYKSAELGTGKWYWRIQPVFHKRIWEGAEYSAVNSFVISEAAEQPVDRNKSASSAMENNPSGGTAPRNIFPPDNFTIEANRTPDLLFTWKSPFPQGNRFQIAEHPDFTGSIVLNEEVSGSNFQCRRLKPGTYYWRLAANAAADTAENSSRPSRLVVIPSLPGPNLRTPAESEKLRIQEGIPVRFSWEQPEYANDYNFGIYIEGREQPLREVSSIHNNSVMVYFDSKTAGRFRWTVQGFTAATETASRRIGLISQGYFSVNLDSRMAQGDQISWTIPRISNMQSFMGEVVSPIRLIYPVSGVNIPGVQALRAPLQALWSSSEPLRNIKLIVSRTTDPLSDPRAIVKYTSGTSTEFPSLGEGIWYWIIQADTYELHGTTPGDPFWLNVLPIPQLPVPGIIQPAGDSVIDLEQLMKDRNIIFKWDTVNGANSYILSLYRDNTSPALIFTSLPQTNTSFTFDNLTLLNGGNYLWQVEAIYRSESGVIEQRGAIVQNSFTIEIQHSSDFQTHTTGTLYGQ